MKSERELQTTAKCSWYVLCLFMSLLVCVCVCVSFRQKVNWVAAVVPETKTTGFVIAVTFLPVLLHTAGSGESVCLLRGWKSRTGEWRGERCCVKTSLYNVYYFFFFCQRENKKERRGRCVLGPLINCYVDETLGHTWNGRCNICMLYVVVAFFWLQW